ncbi:hypothetical protein VitviT2T_025797 [Vitis vinifera]|uniref:Myb-like protein L n=1 Tax=Vitis vinifera TaxID=29760 RepID=A0ABY9DK54_VITVI|nr:uncharacterized protein LOC100268025 isoform X2 [Vitis vinifera]WKA08035.1 hypothetical protein VitviT2T_025797 [Vitis vinifera]|eukprot:XP_002278062.2 PREDICTED: snRNA-activating protein complex subunit 4 isoform X2 [Vitis vinifera]
MASQSGESDDDNDSALDEDLEALRRACILTGSNLNDRATSSGVAATSGAASDADSEGIDDLELVRNIQKRFSIPSEDVPAPLSLKPLSFLPPAVSDEDEDDFEILRAIQKRFSAYHEDTPKSGVDNNLQKKEKVLDSGKQQVDSEDASNSTLNLESFGSKVPENHSSRLGASNFPPLLSKQTSFPKLGHMFVDALKKNRSCQRFLRSKLIELEARLEENKKLKERVKILKDFQVSCRRRMGRALSQKKDARVQLISLPKLKASKNSKVNDKKVSAIYYGPAENAHVANYRMALTEFPLSFTRAKWSKLEMQNLVKGIKQQFQEMLLQKSVDMFSGSERSFEDPNDFDNIMGSITDLEIPPENIRLFLPKVNWEQLASMYVAGRSAAECEARWLNCEDPLINHDPWNVTEDKKLLFILQQRGLNSWIDIAVSLRTNRTPFQCLARYQRSLNACILKREWTVDEDAQLRTAVEDFGEGNWQLIASVLQGRTGTQCSNRWKKTLHPARHRVGRWTADEDKRLKVAVMLFGPKTWTKIAEFVLGRTQVQCRERWVNSLDPSLNWGQWTGEEDAKLKAAIMEHGYCWSKVAACIPPRTDSQCRRRWKVLFPHEVPLLQAARKIQKVALISNFVDRESERPALGPKDFLPVPEMDSVSEPQKDSQKRKRKSKVQPETEGENNAASRNVPKKKRSQKPRNGAETSSKEVPGNSNANEVDKVGGDDANSKKRKRVRKPQSRKAKCSEPIQDRPSSDLDSAMLVITNGEEVGEFAMQGCPSSDIGSAMLMITNGEEVGEFGGHDITDKGDSLVSHSKRVSTVSPESLDPRIIDVDGIETIGANDTTSRRKKSTPKRHPKMNKCAEQSGEHQDSTLNVNGAMSKKMRRAPKRPLKRKMGADQSEEHQASSSHVDSTFDGNNATSNMKKRTPKLHPRRRIYIEQSEEHQASSACLESITSGQAVGTSGGGILIEERAPKPQMQICVEATENRPDTSLHGDSRATVCQQDRPKRSRSRSRSKNKPNSEQSSGAIDVDPISSILHDDADDMTLACFINHRLPKRRLKPAKNDDQGFKVASPPV